MADDGDDDYLSDKFLTVAELHKPKTYSEKRKEALRESRLKSQQNRTKSKREVELESREEGLSKSLFERAEDDKASGRGPENKALSMMMKMGFKPGQALGVPADVEGTASIRDTTPQPEDNPNWETSVVQPQKHERQLVNPLPLNEWSGTLSLLHEFYWDTSSRLFLSRHNGLLILVPHAQLMIGKKGIGLGKRAPSPTELERLAKVARAAEEADKESFRDRSRREFEQRRAETRLGPAQRTCVTLDERAGKEVNKRFLFIFLFWICVLSPPSLFPFVVFRGKKRGVGVGGR